MACDCCPKSDGSFVPFTSLTNLFETGCLPPDFLPYISRSALPSIVKLLSEPARSDLHVPTCDTLRRLVNSEELQQRAMDFDAVEKLALLLETTLPIHAGVFGNQSGPNSAPGAGNPIVETPNLLLESILSALAAVSSLKEEPRRRIVDANLMPRIVVLLDHPDPRVHTAACQCLMSLSRSIKALRSDFVGTEVSRPLLRLLEIGDAQSQSAASGALCNILLDTSSPAKKVRTRILSTRFNLFLLSFLQDVIDSGAVAVLVGLTDSADMGLRLNGLWAIKNLCYRATSQIKASIMEQLTWSRLDSLLRDGQPAVREQATSLLRNLLCNKESDIDEGFKGLGDRLLDGIEGNLSGAQVSDRIALHSLYVVANLATGSLQHKESIMNRLSLLKSVLAYTNHTQIGVRMAALWVVANLTWPDEPGLLQRIHRLRGMGFHEQLVKMNCSDLDVEVKDKVRQVLQQFAMEQRDGRETCVQ